MIARRRSFAAVAATWLLASTATAQSPAPGFGRPAPAPSPGRAPAGVRSTPWRVSSTNHALRPYVLGANHEREHELGRRAHDRAYRNGGRDPVAHALFDFGAGPPDLHDQRAARQVGIFDGAVTQQHIDTYGAPAGHGPAAVGFGGVGYPYAPKGDARARNGRAVAHAGFDFGAGPPDMNDQRAARQVGIFDGAVTQQHIDTYGAPLFHNPAAVGFGGVGYPYGRK